MRPVLPIKPYRKPEEVIVYVNGHERPLASDLQFSGLLTIKTHKAEPPASLQPRRDDSEHQVCVELGEFLNEGPLLGHQLRELRAGRIGHP